MAHPQEQLSRNRSISTGASELPQHEHKRPRLDTALGTTMDPKVTSQPATSTCSRSRTVSPQPPNETTGRPQTPTTTSAPLSIPTSVVSPTSKVTINTRPLSAQSGTNEVAPHSTKDDSDAQVRSTGSSSSKDESPVMVNASDLDSSTTATGDANEPISISSSPSDVVIEIGPPEDVDDTVDVTSWSRSPSSSANSILDTFPYRGDGSKADTVRNMTAIADVLEKGVDSQFTEVLGLMAKWMDGIQPILAQPTLHLSQEDLEVIGLVPSIFHCLLKRRAALPAGASEVDLIDFVKNYARITISMTEVDIRRLRRLTDTTNLTAQPLCVSSDFMRYMCLAIAMEPGVGLHRMLRHTRDISPQDFCSYATKSILDDTPEKPFQMLVALFDELLRTVPYSAGLRSFIPAMVFYYRTLLYAISLFKIPLDDTQSATLRSVTSKFVGKADEALRQAITKQHPWLTIENNGTCLDHFTRLTGVCVTMFPEFVEEVFKAASLNIPSEDLQQLSDLAPQAYKLSLLKQFVQHGRMELRVCGIETMASIFVELWQLTQTLSPAKSTQVVNFVVQFIRNNELVKYILGVDCHPQIVQRSANVIGFLCVSENWEPSDSDIAWQAITVSQDHRSVAAVLETLKVNLQHLQLDALLYMYGKLHEVPFEKFDHLMLFFAVDLINQTTRKADRSSNTEFHVNATIVKLCLHLLRESHTPARCSSELTEQVREQICNLISKDRTSMSLYHVTDMADTDRDSLVKSILQDISDHTDLATGSICVMSAILMASDRMTALDLLASTNYSGLLLDDIVSLCNDRHPEGVQADRSISIECELRLQSLQYLILNAPEAIDASMCEAFCENVLAGRLPVMRSRAWANLAEAFRRVHVTNSFLDHIAAVFFPKLRPELFDKGVLEFCKACISFEMRPNNTHASDTDECMQIPSMERIWKIMLETPEESVQEEACQYIISVYLNNQLVLSKSSLCVQSTHAALVDRCIQTVIESASRLKDCNTSNPGTTPTANHSTLSAFDKNEARLHRSLSLLRKFLNGLKSKPRFRPSASETFGPALQKFQSRGEPIEYTVQVANYPNPQNKQLIWVVGQENTAHELWQFLMDTTGWSQINIIKSGARLQLQDNETMVKDLKLGPGHFQVSKPIGATDVGPGRAVRASSPVDSTVMHHFGELYALLDYGEPIARAIYDFLALFSSQESVVVEIKSMTKPAHTLLPVEKPFKLLYYANALRSCVEEESFSTKPNTEFLQYTVKTIVATLKNVEVIPNEDELCLAILKGILEVLQLTLRAKVPESISHTYFEVPQEFVAHLMRSWAKAQKCEVQHGRKVTEKSMNCDFFDATIDAALHDDRLWHHINGNQIFEELFAFAILSDPQAEARKAAVEVIFKLARTSPVKMAPKANDTRSARGRFSAEKVEVSLQHVWRYLDPLIAQACNEQERCQQMMEASMIVFVEVSKKLSEQTLSGLFTKMKLLLLAQHKPGQGIYCANDYLLLGLAKMMARCASSLITAGHLLSDTGDLITSLFQQFLFPPLSDSTSANLRQQNLPVTDSDTRAALYELVLVLCQSHQQLTTIAGELAESSIDRDAFQALASHDRKSLRSDQGYAGLRNLSNTCYLNSLVSQLFMNVKFRELIIGIKVVDENKQKLITELGNVFANMQSSYEKYANPQEAVESITQYTGEEIDVTVQMDVDEFFNLLFDRLEAQIVDTDARDAFKAFYGGQLVQQIKSKECEHVSERLEPFSAVQVEIKGKSRLEDGLAAYVEGEVLQGENKYSCTSCNRHVDAVKRACLKEIPDNLIFNLKRFDYDIMTGMRCKVNDEFKFPEVIDMKPYTMEALSNPGKEFPSDMFELVGVIIHSGTAETGHYYSFVRQRPSSREAKHSWTQFNDTDVTKFDYEHIADQAFGGADAAFTNFTKFYNGYMLFYQRTSSIQVCEQDYSFVAANNTVSIPLPPDIDNRIAQENEICLRRYVAQDPTHARFVRHIAEKIHVNDEAAPASHSLYTQIIDTVLEYMQQVSSRWKEAPDFEDTVKILIELAKACPKCALAILEWYNVDQNTTTNLMKTWYAIARKSWAMLLWTCYSVLSPLRHTDKKEDTVPIDRQRLMNALTGCLQQIGKDWSQLQKLNRGWEQVFSLLTAIARLSKEDANVLLELEFLSKTAEIVWVHNSPNNRSTPSRLRQKYNDFVVAREKNRQYTLTPVMDLFAELLPRLSLGSPATKGGFAPSEEEVALLGFKDDSDTSFDWLRRLIVGGTNPDAAAKVVQILCECPKYLDQVQRLLVRHFQQEKAYSTCARFLQPCLSFIIYCPEKEAAVKVLKKSLELVGDHDGYHSEQYAAFVQDLENGDEYASLSKDEMREILLKMIGHWAPALLLGPGDMETAVRNQTIIILKNLLFTHLGPMSVQEVKADEESMLHIRELADGCNKYANKHFLQPTTQTHQEQRSNLGSSQAQQITAVLNECLKYLPADEDNAEDEVLVGEIQAVVQELQELQNNVDMEDMEGWPEPESEPMSDMESFETSP